MLPNIALPTYFILSPEAFEFECVSHGKEDDSCGDPGEKQIDLDVEPILVLRGVVIEVRVNALQIHRVEDGAEVAYWNHGDIQDLHKIMTLAQLERLKQNDQHLRREANEVRPF